MTDRGTDRLSFHARRVHVVRYLRFNGDIGMRLYSRRADAVAFAGRLRRYGKVPRIYTSETSAWTETTHQEGRS